MLTSFEMCVSGVEMRRIRNQSRECSYLGVTSVSVQVLGLIFLTFVPLVVQISDQFGEPSNLFPLGSRSA